MTTLEALNYDFIAPRQIVFGWGRRDEAGPLARTLGRRAWIVVGAKALIEQGAIGSIEASLRAAAVEPCLLTTIEREPEVADVDRWAAVVQPQTAEGDLMLAVGGGAAIDLAKAVAAMATQRESATVRDYLENVGRDLKLIETPLPVMAMPTTAGTGAEATRNAVISGHDPSFKKSLRDTRIMPQITLVDPELSVSVPPAVTAASGMDAITQLLESYLSRKARPLPQALARQGLVLAVPALPEAVRQGDSRRARECMAHVALLSGMCLANSGLGMAHGVAAALGVHAGIAHGAACALMLPATLRANRSVCVHEMADLARLLYGDDAAGPDESAADLLIARIESLCDEVGVPRRLADVGVGRDLIPVLVPASRGSSMRGNPRDVPDEELARILEDLL